MSSISKMTKYGNFNFNNALLFVIVLVIMRICFTDGCSRKYFDEEKAEEKLPLAGDTKLLSHGTPLAFKYIRSPNHYIISYSNQKRAPIWGYEKFEQKKSTDKKSSTTASSSSSGATSYSHNIQSDDKIDAKFRGDLHEILKKKDFTMIPIIPPENHRLDDQLKKSSNFVPIKFDDKKKKLWEELNEQIKKLSEDTEVSDLQVCTGALYRSKKSEKAEEEDRTKRGFYAEATKPKKETVTFDDKMEYDILNGGTAAPNALFKAFVYIKNGERKLAAFVIPDSDSPNKPGKTENLENYAYQSIEDLERQSGIYIFEEELHRRFLKCRIQLALTRNNVFKHNLKDSAVGPSNIEQVITKIQTTDELENIKKAGGVPKKGAGFTFGFGEHTVRRHEHHMVYYNHKNLVADWAIESLDKSRKINDKLNGDPFQPDPEMKQPFDTVKTAYAPPYDRGHLVAASNHKITKPIYEETYAMTNMSPQLKKFNTKIWEQFEDCIARYFIKNTVYSKAYIMTGPLYIPDQVTNKMTYNLMVSRTKIAIPTHFFKVIIFERDVNDENTCASGAANSVVSYVIKHDELLAPKKIEINSVQSWDFSKYEKSIDYIENYAGFQIFDKLNMKSDTLIDNVKVTCPTDKTKI